jgi:acyl-coenzyme A synthetase/AMP-(fatty) acid ligase
MITKIFQRNLLEDIIRYGIATFCMLPTFFRFLTKEDFSGIVQSMFKFRVLAEVGQR